ncbi:hypothetical protein V1517DRAFT_291923 [Lipomyces orientalis]|uniref:Uncharacterized protein n=1 Tax=Lipomyces orientalis TaxID=1233043 RepID=A0ACC3TM19_9ASCO
MTSKVAVVTGANKGIGLALATQFSELGYTVIATVRAKAKIAGTPIAHSPNVKFVEMDANNYETIDSAVAEIEKIAPDGVDQVWNNLGVYNIGRGSDDRFKSLDPAELETHYKVNVVSPSYFTSKLIPLLEKGQSKKIVFISSAASSFDVTKQNAEFFTAIGVIPGYASSKSALNMIALSDLILVFPYQLKPLGFTVVPLHPGVVLTSMYVAGPAITPEESASKVRGVVEPLSSTDEFLLRNYDGSILPW